MNPQNQSSSSSQSGPIDLSKSLEQKTPPPSPSWSEESTYFIPPYAPRMVRWMIMYFGGLIKTEKQANYVLVGFIVFAIIASALLFFSGGGPELPPEEEIFKLTPPPSRIIR